MTDSFQHPMPKGYSVYNTDEENLMERQENMADADIKADPNTRWLDKNNYVDFGSPVVELQQFDDKLLVKLENGTYHISTDGKIWKEFYFISKVEYEVLNEK